MTFEEIAAPLRGLKVVRRKLWDKGIAMRYDPISEQLRIWCDGEFGLPAELNAEDWLFADDWEFVPIMPKANPIEDYTSEQTTRSLNPIQPAWYVKASKENDALSKDVKDSDNMESAEKIEITFKSGETITYDKDKWDDYAFDGKAVIVKKNSTWIGIYNFDDVFCVELK